VIDAAAAIGRLGRVKVLIKPLKNGARHHGLIEGDVFTDQFLVIDGVLAAEHFEIELESRDTAS
jgi:hypothetical protein